MIDVVKTLAIAVMTAALILLTLAVLKNTGPSECEALANEYSATVDMQQRDALFSQGINNGCFHQ